MRYEMRDESAFLLFNIEVAQDVFLVRLHAPHIAAQVVPGQFVEVRVSEGVSPFLRLPLSVCQRDCEAGTIDLIYEDVGPKSGALRQLEPGFSTACLGPLGRGFQDPAADRRAVLVGGGVGVPPLLFLGENLQQAGGEVALLVGARTAAKHLPDALLNPAAPRVEKATDDGSLGHGGPVTDLLQRELERGRDCAVFTCGPHAMMGAVAALCRQVRVPCQASLEEYMACGFGVCVGCVVEVVLEDEVSPDARYSRVCVDGPVFDAHLVRWEV